MAVAFTGLLLVGFQKKQIDWRAFVPFLTTRNDVEADLGAPFSGKDYIWIYDTAEERLTVWYGGGKSSGTDGCRWDIPKETVFQFVLAPKKRVRLAEMNIDLSKFQKQKAPEMVQDYYYYNENEGTTITTRIAEGKEVLMSIERGPNSAQRQEYCRKTNC